MKRGKQFAAMVLSLTLVAAWVPGVPVRAEEAPDTAAQTEVPENMVPKIRLSVGNGQATPQYQAGQTVEGFQINVQNQGTADAQNVRITPVIENAADWPFEIESMNYELSLGTIAAGTVGTAEWQSLLVRNDVESKAYKLRFQISYDDGTKEYQNDRYVYVKTTAAPAEEPEQPADTEIPDDSGSADGIEAMDAGGIYNSDPTAVGGGSGNTTVPRVIVTGFDTDPGTVNAGSNFRLVIHVKNTSSVTAVSNMLFDLQAPSSGTEAAAEAPAFLPASGSSSIYLDCIPAGETRDIAIDLNARADLVQKPYSIAMTMKYEDSSAAQYEGASSVAIPVQQAARFEFSDIELSPSSIQVGEEANLTCSLYNTGRTKLYNVKVKFSGDGITGKDVFVGNIDSGATGTIDGMLTGESEIPAGTKCKMVVSYEDEAGKVSTAEKEFEIEVIPAEQGDMDTMMEPVAEEKGFPVLPVVAAVIIIIVGAAAVILIRRRKKKRALAEEEDLADEVDRFTEDE